MTVLPHAPRPGRDQITVTAATIESLCYSRGHRTQGRLADVIVVFGELGTGPGDALWRESWGTSRAMCAECWEQTFTVVAARRPNLVVHDCRVASTPPAPGKAGPP